MLVRSGIHLVKLWFSVSRGEQRSRFIVRQIDPVRQWKLSPTDLASLDKWDEYTEAKEAMFLHTDTADAPWTVIKSNDKKRARLEAMRHVLATLDYTDKDPEAVGTPDPLHRRGRRRRPGGRVHRCRRVAATADASGRTVDGRRAGRGGRVATATPIASLLLAFLDFLSLSFFLALFFAKGLTSSSTGR